MLEIGDLKKLTRADHTSKYATIYGFDIRSSMSAEEGNIQIELEFPTLLGVKNRDALQMNIKPGREKIYTEGFQLTCEFRDRLEQFPIAGIVIGFDNKPRVVIVAYEYAATDMWGHKTGAYLQSLYALKANPEDPHVLVTPSLPHHRGVPYVLENHYDDGRWTRPGLLLLEPTLDISYRENEILITRVTPR